MNNLNTLQNGHDLFALHGPWHLFHPLVLDHIAVRSKSVSGAIDLESGTRATDFAFKIKR